MARHNLLGAWGEKVAREFLLSQGYALVANNVRIGSIEIDIVVQKGKRLVFVEVKTRSKDNPDLLNAIDTRKIARMARAADDFVRARRILYEVQFDIIVVIGETGSSDPKITHIEDAFRPPLSTR